MNSENESDSEDGEGEGSSEDEDIMEMVKEEMNKMMDELDKRIKGRTDTQVKKLQQHFTTQLTTQLPREIKNMQRHLQK